MQFKKIIVTVDRQRSIAEGIAAGKYFSVDSKISTRNFKRTGRGKTEVEVILYRLEADTNLPEILLEMKWQNIRPVDLQELLAIGEQFPGLQQKLSVVALGSLYKDGEYHRAPFLNGKPGERKLDSRGFCMRTLELDHFLDDTRWFRDRCIFPCISLYTGTFETVCVKLNGSQSIEDAIRAGMYEEAFFETRVIPWHQISSSSKTTEIRLINFKNVVSAAEVCRYLDENNLVFAGPREFLALGQQYPEKQKENPIITMFPRINCKFNKWNTVTLDVFMGSTRRYLMLEPGRSSSVAPGQRIAAIPKPV